MSEESQKERGERAARRDTEDGGPGSAGSQGSGETLKALVPLLTDLIPLFLDKWSEIHHRPSVRDLEDRQSRMGRRIKKIAGQLGWHRIFFAGLLIWNIILTALYVIK